MNDTVDSSIKVHTMFFSYNLFAGYKYALFNIPVLVFLAKKVVMAGISQGFLLLAIVYTTTHWSAGTEAV